MNTHPIDLDLKYTDEGAPAPFYCQAMADGRLYVYADHGETGWANVAGRRPPTVALVNRQEIRFGVYMQPTGGGWEYSPVVCDFAKGRSVAGGKPTRAAVKAIVAAVQAAIPGWLKAHPRAFTSSKRAELEHRLRKAHEEAAETAIRIRKIEAEIAAL